MNRISKLALSAAFTLGFTSFASAAPILDGAVLEGFVGSAKDNHGSYVQLTDSDGDRDNFSARLYIWADGLQDGDVFGLYKRGDTSKTVSAFPGARAILFNFEDGSVSNGSSSSVDDFGTTFGFYLGRGDDVWYSDSDLNGGQDVAGFYAASYEENTFFVGFQDPDTSESFSVVIGMQDVVTVSEPGTLALFGLGLLAVGLSRSRKS